MATPTMNRLRIVDTDSKIRVLFLEDNPLQHKILESFIRQQALGYDYLIIPSVKAARDILAEQSFDVAIVDYYLEDGVASELYEELTGTPLIMVTTAADRNVAVEAMKAGAVEYLVKDQDLTYLRILPHAITQAYTRKCAMDRLRLLSHAMTDIREAVYITNPQGRVVFVNHALADTLGFEEEELIGTRENVFLEDVDVAEGRELNKSWRGETFARKRDGTRVPILLSRCELVLPGQKSPSVVGVVSDIAELRRIEQERIELAESLGQSQKMNALGMLAGGIAHDFNNVLASIRGFAEVSLLSVEENSTIGQNLQEVIRAADRASCLVDQIKDFSRANDAQYESLNVKRIIEEVVSLVSATAPKHVRVMTDILEDNLFVFANPTQLHQLVMNLSINAVQALGDKPGFVTVRLEQHHGPCHASPAADQTTDYARISVIDTGSGIPPEILGKIFEPLFTTKKDTRGTGFGLSLAKKVVDSLDGAIRVTSKPGNGSTFEVLLPLTTRAAQLEPESGHTEVQRG
ncbi:MAG: response regulator [Deltaproteobacteria bacterium]|nr:response regulator [Deltaproteobacteria bacterium]